MKKSMFWWDYTSNDIRDLDKGTIVVQPIASVEQHGPHLPVATDSLINAAFVERLAKRFEQEEVQALFLPLMPYGKSNEHLYFPGTITLAAKTLMDVTMDIAESVKRAGFRKFVFLNSHGGNHELLDLMCREIRIQTGLETFALHPLLKIQPKRPEEFAMSELEAKHGIHAGQAETAILLRVADDLVQKERIKAEYPVNFEGMNYLDFNETIPYGWMTQDVTESGTLGDPSKATAQEGERWLSDVTDELVKAFQDIVKYRFREAIQ